MRLMNRTTRSVALTEAGRLLLPRLAPALGEIRRRARSGPRPARASPSGRLRINAPEPAVELVLAPMIAPFLAAYPQIDLKSSPRRRLVDIVAGASTPACATASASRRT